MTFCLYKRVFSSETREQLMACLPASAAIHKSLRKRPAEQSSAIGVARVLSPQTKLYTRRVAIDSCDTVVTFFTPEPHSKYWQAINAGGGNGFHHRISSRDPRSPVIWSRTESPPREVLLLCVSCKDHSALADL
jgi:hypothetical protein